MPKSSHQLEIEGVYFMRNFSYLITQIYNRREDWLGDIEKTPLEYYADFYGWEYILFQCNGDIPFLWASLTVCQKLNIKYKLARYQVYAITQHFKIHRDLTKAEIDKIVENIK